MTGESVNILNAYADERFNKEIDRKSNYKTNTILCVPIMSKYNEIIGNNSLKLFCFSFKKLNLKNKKNKK